MTNSSTILIVDDNQDVVNILSITMDACGHQTLAAYDGVEALTILEHQLPDLIILDIDMPKMNGIEVLSHLKRQQPTQDIPVIIFSAMGSLLHPQIQMSGIVEFVSKGTRTYAELGDLVEHTLCQQNRRLN